MSQKSGSQGRGVSAAVTARSPLWLKIQFWAKLTEQQTESDTPPPCFPSEEEEAELQEEEEEEGWDGWGGGKAVQELQEDMVFIARLEINAE